jgi:hypothetical protein
MSPAVRKYLHNLWNSLGNESMININTKPKNNKTLGKFKKKKGSEEKCSDSLLHVPL